MTVNARVLQQSFSERISSYDIGWAPEQSSDCEFTGTFIQPLLDLCLHFPMRCLQMWLKWHFDLTFTPISFSHALLVHWHATE